MTSLVAAGSYVGGRTIVLSSSAASSRLGIELLREFIDLVLQLFKVIKNILHDEPELTTINLATTGQLLLDNLEWGNRLFH